MINLNFCPTTCAGNSLNTGWNSVRVPLNLPANQLDYFSAWLPFDAGAQLGAGCFGRVLKAKAFGIKGSDKEKTVSTKTVAVKMVRSNINLSQLETLISELKILIYLGSHLNVLNLLGACTTEITKGYHAASLHFHIFFYRNVFTVILGELLIIVEYCQFGNLQNYLAKHRRNFKNQLNEYGHVQPSDSEECDAVR